MGARHLHSHLPHHPPGRGGARPASPAIQPGGPGAAEPGGHGAGGGGSPGPQCQLHSAGAQRQHEQVGRGVWASSTGAACMRMLRLWGRWGGLGLRGASRYGGTRRGLPRGQVSAAPCPPPYNCCRGHLSPPHIPLPLPHLLQGLPQPAGHLHGHDAPAPGHARHPADAAGGHAEAAVPSQWQEMSAGRGSWRTCSGSCAQRMAGDECGPGHAAVGGGQQPRCSRRAVAALSWLAAAAVLCRAWEANELDTIVDTICCYKCAAWL